MISNSEVSDPECVEHCYVAMLVYLYEMSKVSSIFSLTHV